MNNCSMAARGVGLLLQVQFWPQGHIQDEMSDVMSVRAPMGRVM
jgi:hypothetical protein